MSTLLRWQRGDRNRTLRMALVGTFRDEASGRDFDEYYTITSRRITSAQTRWELLLVRRYFDGSWQTVENFPHVNPFTQYRRARMHAQMHLNAREERS